MSTAIVTYPKPSSLAAHTRSRFLLGEILEHCHIGQILAFTVYPPK